MIILLSISLGGGQYIKKFKLKYFNESLFSTIIGVLAGMILYLSNQNSIIDSITNAYVKFFLIILLPPILFESAYNMENKPFYRNIGTIIIYAIIGTLLSIFFIGFSIYLISLTGIYKPFTLTESFAYSSLISSTDPVAILSTFKDYTIDSNFFQLIYGESILNDAISIVFYETCVKFSIGESSILYSIGLFLLIFFGSIILGYIIGYLTALFLRIISNKVKNIKKVEVSLMIILPWLSYLTAQMLGLSGIVSLLFNGIAHSTYTKPNLTDWSKIVYIIYNNRLLLHSMKD